MAPGRAFSFPLSHSEEFSRQSPFTIDPSDAAHLTSCEAFRCIRDLLDCRDNNLFCDAHSDIDPIQKEAWLLQRDITFALVFPLLEVHRKATAIALGMLGDRNIFDLELVFRGEARGAFSWLQCFTTVEQSWCAAEGCPACNVSYVLQSEPIIRLVITACHLASRILDQQPRHSHSDSQQQQSQSQPQSQSRQHNLPILDFWTQTLRRALSEDRFWGRDSWKTLGDRARGLEDGIFAMAQQCCELERITIITPGGGGSGSDRTTTTAATISPHQPAKTQGKLNNRENMTTKEAWMHQIVLGCWTTLRADAVALQTHQQQQQREEQSPPAWTTIASDSTRNPKPISHHPSRPLSANL